MPSDVSDLSSSQDPSVVKQWDNDVSQDIKFKDFYAIADSLKVCLLSTYRSQIGPVSRSMAVAKRTGPDFLFLANGNSQKFKDLETNPEVNVAFQDSTSQHWISVSGEAVTVKNDDSRIKEIWNRGAAAWFGDLGDGVHDGSATDPRMWLIEVKAKCEFSLLSFLHRLS